MKNLPLLIGTILVTILFVFGVGYLFSRPATPTPTAEVDRTLVEGGQRNIKGTPATASAQVTVVEFSDFQCPSCRAVEPMVAGLAQQYGENVRFVYRHFPLEQIHPNARAAAQVSEIAAAEGKFWEMHDVLFDAQDEWSDVSNRGELLGLFEKYAVQVGLDGAAVRQKMESGEGLAAVDADTSAALQLNVPGTPTFYVNGVQVATQQLEQAIDAALTTAVVLPAESESTATDSAAPDATAGVVIN